MKAGIYTANTTAQAVGANSALPLGSIGFGWVLPALAGLAGGLLLSRFSH